MEDPGGGSRAEGPGRKVPGGGSQVEDAGGGSRQRTPGGESWLEGPGQRVPRGAWQHGLFLGSPHPDPPEVSLGELWSSGLCPRPISTRALGGSGLLGNRAPWGGSDP